MFSNNRQTGGMTTARVVVVVAIAVAVIVMAVSDVSAFDGKRKGFTIGIGGNVSPVVSYTTVGFGQERYRVDDTVFVVYPPMGRRENNEGLGGDFLIGYAWNERDVISYMEHFAIYQTDPALTLGTSVLAWSHYFGRTGKSVFSMMGVGRCVHMNLSCSSADNLTGFAVVLGLGYEFARHWSVSAVLQQGNFKYRDLTYDCTMLSVGLDVAAY